MVQLLPSCLEEVFSETELPIRPEFAAIRTQQYGYFRCSMILNGTFNGR
jgi:hypothetical protein